MEIFWRECAFRRNNSVLCDYVFRFCLIFLLFLRFRWETRNKQQRESKPRFSCYSLKLKMDIISWLLYKEAVMKVVLMFLPVLILLPGVGEEATTPSFPSIAAS